MKLFDDWRGKKTSNSTENEPTKTQLKWLISAHLIVSKQSKIALEKVNIKTSHSLDQNAPNCTKKVDLNPERANRYLEIAPLGFRGLGKSRAGSVVSTVEYCTRHCRDQTVGSCATIVPKQ